MGVRTSGHLDFVILFVAFLSLYAINLGVEFFSRIFTIF